MKRSAASSVMEKRAERCPDFSNVTSHSNGIFSYSKWLHENISTSLGAATNRCVWLKNDQANKILHPKGRRITLTTVFAIKRDNGSVYYVVYLRAFKCLTSWMNHARNSTLLADFFHVRDCVHLGSIFDGLEPIHQRSRNSGSRWDCCR